jgi:replicative DNA helicase
VTTTVEPPADLDIPADISPARTYDRTPPHDDQAEQCVLGAMLLSKDAIADIIDIVKPADWYRGEHKLIYEAICDLFARGDPADPIAVAAHLMQAGHIGRVGGAPYLHTLIALVPTAASGGYYARIVAEKAQQRRLIEAGTRIVQLGYGAGAGDVADAVDTAQQAVYDLTSGDRRDEGWSELADLMQPTLDEVEAAGAAGSGLRGIPTGFTDLDRLLNGLHPGQLVVVAGRPGLGKVLRPWISPGPRRYATTSPRRSSRWRCRRSRL